jgi:hydrogenase-4 component B
VIERAWTAWAPDLALAAAPLAEAAPLGWLSLAGVALVVLFAAGGIALARRTRGARAASGATWGCGYALPTPRMQYTSSSFAELLVGLFSWALRPHVELRSPVGLFPGPSAFESHVHDTVLARAVLPASRATARALSWFRWVQRGSVHLYLLYILAALVLLLLVRR